MRVRKSLMIVMLVAIMLVPATIVLAESQGQDKVAVCHVDGQGSFIPISIADPALDTHFAHGDVYPGVFIKGNYLDANCNICPYGNCPAP